MRSLAPNWCGADGGGGAAAFDDGAAAGSGGKYRMLWTSDGFAVAEAVPKDW